MTRTSASAAAAGRPGPLPVVVSDVHRRHDPPYELNAGRVTTPVYERPARVDALREALAAAGHPLLAPRDHDDVALTAVHDPAMVAFLRDGWERWRGAGGPEVMIPDTFSSARWAGGGRRPQAPLGEPGWWCTDTATPVVAGSWAAARVAVDIALTGVDLLRDGEVGAYALCRPPGHHAGRDYFGGFCLCNNAAVAARALMADGRVAVLDLDFHHGNGTQDIFWEEADVLYVSLHGDPAEAFPFFSGFTDEVGAGPGRGATRNLPLPAGTTDERWLAALDGALEVVGAFGPVAVVVSLGFDSLAADPIASFELSPGAYDAIGQRVSQLGLPTLFVQEGGYALDVIGEAAVRTMAGFASAR